MSGAPPIRSGSPWLKDAGGSAAAIRAGELSPTELTEAAWSRIDDVNPDLNAFVTELREESIAQAAAAEAELAGPDADAIGPLHGVPIAVKDLTPTAGVRTTYGSPNFADNVPSEDSLAWARLRSAGAILLGKTTTPDLGWLAITESTLTGVTRNPCDPSRTAGGSSGGSAVAVAAGMAPLALGSDGAGSIRVPASFCGVVGLKPSYGRVPLHGEDLVFSSTEAVGPLTCTVADAALMLDVLAGPDPREPFALGAPAASFVPGADASVAGLRIAYCPDLGGAPATAAVLTALDLAAGAFESELSAHVERTEVALIDPLEHLTRFWGPATAALLEELGEQAGDAEGSWPPSLLALAASGRSASAIELWNATVVERGRMHAQIAAVFADHDLLLTPTVPISAFEHPGLVGGPATVAGQAVADPATGFLRFTAPFNMTGHPAISLPCGVDADGLPLGMQLVARHGEDRLLLEAAACFERARPWLGKAPVLG